ncbi:MAG: hypothetical protein V8K32_05065 [Candidatus Electrothrix gigas]
MNPAELLFFNRKIRKLACHYLPRVLSLSEIHSLQPKISSMETKGQLIYLNMVYKKSIWQFIKEALSILIADPSDENIKFISNKYYRKRVLKRSIIINDKSRRYGFYLKIVKYLIYRSYTGIVSTPFGSHIFTKS